MVVEDQLPEVETHSLDTCSSISPTASIESLAISHVLVLCIVSFPDYIFQACQKRIAVGACSMRLRCMSVSGRMTRQANHGARPRLSLWVEPTDLGVRVGISTSLANHDNWM